MWRRFCCNVVDGTMPFSRRAALWSHLGKEQPIRAELYGREKLEAEAALLAAADRDALRAGGGGPMRARLEENDRQLRMIHASIVAGAKRGETISPAAEWFLDNFHLVLDQIREVRQDFPSRYERELPHLTRGEFAGYPRVYSIATTLVAHTDSNPDMETLKSFLDAYQAVAPLSIGELWAIAVALRVALIENLRRLAGRMEVARRERAKADALTERVLSALETATGLPEREAIAEAVLKAPERRELRINPTFAVRLIQRLRDVEPSLSTVHRWIEEGLAEQGLSVESAVLAEHQRQTSAQATIANIISSMRLFSQAAWPDFVESVSAVERILEEDPAGAYAGQDFPTRDRYRHVVEGLGGRNGAREVEAARRAVELARGASDARKRHVGYFLVDDGLPDLEREVGARPGTAAAARRFVLRSPAAFYIGSILLVTAALETVTAAYARARGAGAALLAVSLLLSLIPGSELAQSIVNFSVNFLFPPRLLPKLKWPDGIPDEFRTLVAVPSFLGDEEEIRDLLSSLEIRSYANPDPNLRFALLTDFPDADAATIEGEEKLLRLAEEGVRELNSRASAPGRFWLLHRKRSWNPSEGKWMGWERKRGKLTELNRLLRGRGPTSFEVVTAEPRDLARIRFVLTLDADTRLPRESASALAGTLAHPLNLPRVDPGTGNVAAGRAIVQPRVSVTPESANRSPFAQISSGHAGIDPYTTAVSNVYQDLFGEGSFTGKAIYDVEAFEAALSGRIPENAILSHDLLEGCLAGSALATDIEIFEDHPSSYDVYTRRQHRWVRGDWQIFRWLGRTAPMERGKAPNPLSAISRWKIFDNLRRSLLAPALFFWLVAAWLFLPGSPFFWTTLAVSAIAFPIVFHLAEGLTIHTRGVPWTSQFWSVWGDLLDNCAQFALRVAFLPHLAEISLDAAARALYRQGLSRRHLLEWTTAAAAEKDRVTTVAGYARRMGRSWAASLAVAAATAAFAPGHLPAAAGFLFLWLTAPALAAGVSRPIRRERRALSEADVLELRETARLTWRFFEQLANPAEHDLPPDNFQEDPEPRIAHRTSPTNIGFSLLSSVAAFDFGYLGLRDLVGRLERGLAVVESLPRLRGHLYNWYDTTTLAPLPPRYVSAVDSGNLAASLIALKQSCLELAEGPPQPAGREGLSDLIRLVQQEVDAIPAAGVRTEAIPLRQLRSQVTALAALPGAAAAPDAAVLAEIEQAGGALEDAVRALAQEHPELPLAQLLGLLGDVGRQAKSLGRDREDGEVPDLAAALRDLAARSQKLVDDMDFTFLFDQERKVFSIGWNAQMERLDKSYYDLLISEARLTSFCAIAKGDVPTEHWFRLQRPFALSFKRPILLSWSGSMFEYLMPLLLLRSYPDTLLHETCNAAVDAQIQYGRARRVPWGASESAYNARDLHLNYQYGPFGVPELGLRRVAPDELVISPYSTFLALLADPSGAPENLRRLAAEGARGAFGYYESIDYTPRRLPPGSPRSVVKAFMAHHQGMILLSIHNAVLGDRMRNRFHSDPAVQATELLLQERIPRNTAALAGSIVAQVAAGRVVREEVAIPTRRFDSPDSSTPRSQILSNGSYSVLVTAAGSGFSRRGGVAVTRWRDDPTSDSWGSWIYLRDVRSGEWWSAGHQPTARRARKYEAKFSEHKAEFLRSDDGIETRTEVIVSAQADVEIRRVTLTNTSAKARDERDIEVTSYAEIVLADPSADLAHPAFSKMFLETEWNGGRLLCRRRPRSPGEKTAFAAHAMGVSGTSLGGVQHETDRARFLGRGRSPRAPAVLVEDRPLSDTTGAVLDPIFSLRHRVRVPAGHSVQLVFATSVADSAGEALALVDRFKDPSLFDRESSLAWMRSQVLLRHLTITSDEAQLFQRIATRAFYNDPSLRPGPETLARNTGSVRGLWAQGISGDLPIVLVRIADTEEIDLARQLLRAHEYWSLKGIAVDLVIVTESPTGYLQPLQEQLNAILGAAPSRLNVDKPGGIFVRSADKIPEEERVLLETAARAVLVGSKGTLSDQAQRIPSSEILPAPFASTAPIAVEEDAPLEAGKLSFFNGIGGFSADRREYVIVLLENQYTPAPWSNVVSNPSFGFLVTESGSGCTWAENSHENRLTPWSNDPVSDPPGEAIYLRDEETGEVWTPTPLPIRDAKPYVCRHGQGYSKFLHRRSGIESELAMFVPAADPVKILRLRLTNASRSPRRISATFYAEWVLGSERAASARFIVTEPDAELQAIFARNVFNADFASRLAFARAGGSLRSWTADRREFLGRNGHPADPAALRRAGLSGRSGAGLDPCAALQSAVDLEPGESRDVVFLLGETADRKAAADLIERYGEPADAEKALGECVAAWDRTLGAVQVRTPDSAFDLLVNRWLVYQTLSCRVWGRTGFYQSSGGFGFRDQLQDVTALLACAPDEARRQIERAASRQFPEGDVQHWWHPPAGRGIRSRCSDDLLWLPFVASLYADATGDTALWDVETPFLDAPKLGSAEAEAYQEPRVSAERAAIYEHCVRAIDRSLPRGEHGLPLIGTGDWNDGYNRVGIGGKGESVWLGWFLLAILQRFPQLCESRGDRARAERYRKQAASLKAAVESAGWDGDWYRRAYFDDGSTLGSAADAECRIDSLSQAWAVLSGAGDKTRTARAMVAVHEYLVRREDGLVLLLAPPFDRSPRDPGYIQGYPPGVRENGGQYTHAAAWVVMAFARLGDGDLASELFSLLNPISPTSTRAGLHKYKVEPYVTAGDVYSVAPLTGRGGWTWYTGSSAWLHRAAIESICGLRLEGRHFSVDPCVPRRWTGFEIDYRDGDTLYRIRVENPKGVCRGVESVEVDGVAAPAKRVCREHDGKTHDVVVRLG